MAADIFENGVIVADNDYLIRGILRSMLEAKGLSVFLASDGIEAVTYATRIVVRLVILDLNMPRLNGFCTCEQIRQLPGYARIPIVVLTAYDALDMRVAAERVGVTRFFGKPFTVVDLLEGILPLLGPGFTGGSPAPLATRPAQQVWERRERPASTADASPELIQGRRVLNIYRR